MFTTRQLAAIAVLAVCLIALLAGKPEGDASISPPRPDAAIRPGMTQGAGIAAGSAPAEAVFAARYAAAFEKGIYPGLPVTMCEAKLLECRGLDYAACREACRQACGLE
ncbi:hypothetical protein G3N56_03005 [Desulfovibrio sulfodismutans]|uniref:Uncharacterized protein n=1 Tax=Desulfolutivibrio sulfodismutans TaxID=63561 RepID=A0A7K3NHN6_9BACT|nr:hypothetical protein [Desulfolutivibrio sulfodismutans]NDY55711.1 hypothetical protein [Desulfolutivibrio sulfodismutans]QLA13731.1 hypothetical protein GD606_16435 [Desulfolutivibrio sulfodismutans DSM 3696]